jgi:hypothetical protein
MMIGAVAVVVGAWLGLAPQQGSPADSVARLTVSTGVAPETVTVGDRFRSYVRLKLPAGARAELGGFPASDSLQLTDSVFPIARDSAGAGEAAGAYPLVAWIAGEPLRQSVPVTVILAGGERRVYRVALRLPVVRSVLPAGEEELQPRPAKGLLSAPRREWPWWWLLLIPALAALALLVRRLLARRGAAPYVDPRAEALARLDGLRGGATAPDPFYTAVTRVLREYLARVDARFGEDLTTTELLGRAAERDVPVIDRAGLAALLHRADPVKFGAAVPPLQEMEAFWGDARAWVEANPAPVEARREAA